VVRVEQKQTWRSSAITTSISLARPWRQTSNHSGRE
jgi:hypothetical protein